MTYKNVSEWSTVNYWTIPGRKEGETRQFTVSLFSGRSRHGQIFNCFIAFWMICRQLMFSSSRCILFGSMWMQFSYGPTEMHDIFKTSWGSYESRAFIIKTHISNTYWVVRNDNKIRSYTGKCVREIDSGLVHFGRRKLKLQLVVFS